MKILAAFLFVFGLSNLVYANGGFELARPSSDGVNEPMVEVGEVVLNPIDPRFGFESAKNAFSESRAPTSDEMSKQWLTVGTVYGPAVPAQVRYNEFYDQSGNFRIQGAAGYFRNYLNFGIADAFGHTLFTVVDTRVGAETGKIYYKDTFACKMLKSGLSCENSGTSGSAEKCSITFEVRVFAATGMLLAGLTNIDQRADCQKYYGLNQINKIVGSMAR